jgi:hypothetical protein
MYRILLLAAWSFGVVVYAQSLPESESDLLSTEEQATPVLIEVEAKVLDVLVFDEPVISDEPMKEVTVIEAAPAVEAQVVSQIVEEAAPVYVEPKQVSRARHSRAS